VPYDDITKLRRLTLNLDQLMQAGHRPRWRWAPGARRGRAPDARVRAQPRDVRHPCSALAMEPAL